MSTKNFATIDGNEAVARVAYQLNEVIVIYPITPSSPMGEWADTWSAKDLPNLWGTVPSVVEMQSEGGAAGAIHGALQTGSLTTTFTASQGLLLMLPNLYKIAGELTSAVIHVAARSLAAQALSIFGDHSDVMSARATGCALLCSTSVQEAQDFALIAHAVTLAGRIPFIHFFDGFRTSHEIQKIELLEEEDLRALIDDNLVLAHRDRALTPDHPVVRGTAQNPDVYFQARESVNPFYARCPELVQQAMDKLGERTGRYYKLYEYHGAEDAEKVIVIMGSGGDAVQQTVDFLNETTTTTVGVLKVRLYRPFDASRLVAALPKTVKRIAVLDRTKEPGSLGEPLYLDVVTALSECWQNLRAVREQPLPKVVGGRYGLSSKEFNPAMIKGIFDNLDSPQPQNHFTIGINDDLSHTSLSYDRNFSIEPNTVFRAMFYGLGSDGTVGANKNTIKIIGTETDNYAQGYFVYDSKKSGAVTVSHLRFGAEPILAPYLIDRANFVGCHQWMFLEKLDILENAASGATFLLNSPYHPDEVWHYLPLPIQEQIVRKNLKLYVIDADRVARDSGMGGRINTILQTCFFALAEVLPSDEAIAKIKQAIKKTYGKKGEEIVQKNLQAVDATLEHLYRVKTSVDPILPASTPNPPSSNLNSAPQFVRDVTNKILTHQGDELPVSALPCDGTYPTGTSKWEKRNVGQFIPVWQPDACVQCNKCVTVCPHSAIRSKTYQPELLKSAPTTFKAIAARDKDFKGQNFSLQVAPEDCTGCAVCIDVCPAKDKIDPTRRAINLEPQLALRELERANWDFFLNLPLPDRRNLKLNQIRQQQLEEPLFEFSGACAGCGETPYLKMVTQLFGDRMVVANATGCSSIYGGNLPTTPWTKNAQGQGVAWSNSLFEDNAEFGLGFRVSIDKHAHFASELLQQLAGKLGDNLVTALLNNPQKSEADIYQQRETVAQLKQKLQQQLRTNDRGQITNIQQLLSLADYLVKKSVWIIGGDGWAYDIGYGGLDHVIASGSNVNILVMDTEVYSNTGGQSSKATPRGAVAKFATSGKPAAKKDLGLIAMTYGNVYVASVAMGAKPEQTLKTFLEAEAYQGPSLIIAYSHCIAHGINMTTGMNHQRSLVDSGRWLLYRYNPDLKESGKNPLQLDSRQPKETVDKSIYTENRFKMLTKANPDRAKELLAEFQEDVTARWQMYQYLAAR
ncbi:MAG: pyruvate:ferredoxin (flavodoxin) oxidoreductase [Pleurocapsa sp.]